VRIELIPSSVSAGADAPQFLSSYLVNDAVCIDGGSVGLLADVDRQRAVGHVFLTHAHLDHVASLPLLVENVYEPGPECVEILGSAETLASIRRDLFNDRIWPDFFRLSTPHDAFLRATPLEPLKTVERAGLRITPVPVTHSCETLAMIVDDGRSCVAFAADTGPTDLLWHELATRPTLRGVFLECSFPDGLADFASRIGHLCPTTFRAERARLPADVRCFAVHRKARHAATIARELAALDMPGVELARPGVAYDLEPDGQPDLRPRRA
jgi:ribonuclease BN (tRNA processing enzyme)